MEVIFAPIVHLAKSRNIFCSHDGGRGAVTGIQWVEIKDAARYPMVYKKVSQNKELSIPKCH